MIFDCLVVLLLGRPRNLFCRRWGFSRAFPNRSQGRRDSYRCDSIRQERWVVRQKTRWESSAINLPRYISTNLILLLCLIYFANNIFYGKTFAVIAHDRGFFGSKGWLPCDSLLVLWSASIANVQILANSGHECFASRLYQPPWHRCD